MLRASWGGGGGGGGGQWCRSQILSGRPSIDVILFPFEGTVSNLVCVSGDHVFPAQVYAPWQNMPKDLHSVPVRWA